MPPPRPPPPAPPGAGGVAVGGCCPGAAGTCAPPACGWTVTTQLMIPIHAIVATDRKYPLCFITAPWRWSPLVAGNREGCQSVFRRVRTRQVDSNVLVQVAENLANGLDKATHGFGRFMSGHSDPRPLGNNKAKQRALGDRHNHDRLSVPEICLSFQCDCVARILNFNEPYQESL